MQLIPCADVFPLLKAGRRRPAKIAMIAMTTSNSIKVKPRRWTRRGEETEVISNQCSVINHRSALEEWIGPEKVTSWFRKTNANFRGSSGFSRTPKRHRAAIAGIDVQIKVASASR